MQQAVWAKWAIYEYTASLQRFDLIMIFFSGVSINVQIHVVCGCDSEAAKGKALEDE